MGDAKVKVGLLKKTFKDFLEDECPMRAAALSYYTTFSLAPLLVLIVMVASLFVSPEQVREVLTTQAQGMVGAKGAEEITVMLENANRPDFSKGFASIASLAGLLFGATGAFMQLQTSLNKAWEVEPDPDAGGVKNFISKRLLSLGMILGIAFLLLVSLALSTVISAMGGVVSEMLGGGIGPVVQSIFDILISAVIFTLLFAAIFKILPDAEVAWKDVWVGALVTTALFVVGKFALGIYLGRSNPGEAFGAAGSLAVILVWIYYSSMIVLLGAEFTQKWAERQGSGITPEEGAQRVKQVKVRPGEDDDPSKEEAGQTDDGGTRTASSAPRAAAPADRPHYPTPLLDARRRELAEEDARAAEEARRRE